MPILTGSSRLFHVAQVLCWLHMQAVLFLLGRPGATVTAVLSSHKLASLAGMTLRSG